MSDDLAAFFAKKANKSKDRKKKGVINIEDVGQQLERKAKIHETGEFEGENQERKSSLEITSKINQNAEDSEWIDFNEKPDLDKFTFKEFNEPNEDELEEEKRRLKEPNKTWNIVEPQKEVSVENVINEPTRYVPKAQRRAEKVVDINNEEMFPSIANAEEVEKIQKAQEEERRIEFEEQKKKQEEHKKRLEEERRSKYPARQYQQDQPSEMTLSPSSRKPFQRSTNPSAPKSMEPSAADDADTWRRGKDTSPAAPQMTAPATGYKAPSTADDASRWRSNQQSGQKTSSEQKMPDEDGWRTATGPKKSEPKDKETPVTNPAPAQAEKYVPPSMRNKQ